MSFNSAATPDGREIGRAQALQAEACRATPCAEMNPILLKPSSDTSSQVISLGEIWGEVTVSNYHTHRVEGLFPEVLESYRRLAARYDLVLLEGAGSPVEINLREHDIVNLRMAHAADAACLLIGDIDRGGVFASLLGTMDLLEPEDRARIGGFVINKFRGDESLLRAGVAMMERRLGLPCAGVVRTFLSSALMKKMVSSWRIGALPRVNGIMARRGPCDHFASALSLFRTWPTSPTLTRWPLSLRFLWPSWRSPRKCRLRTSSFYPEVSKRLAIRSIRWSECTLLRAKCCLA